MTIPEAPCPKCQSLIVPGAGVFPWADYCGTCRGHWLPGKAITMHLGGRTGIVPGSSAQELARTGVQCPDCRTVSLVLLKRDGLEFERCPTCFGVFLDDGELNQVVRRARGQSKFPGLQALSRATSETSPGAAAGDFVAEGTLGVLVDLLLG